MSEERLRRAAGALERSVAEVDVMERLEALGRRRSRQRSTTTVLAVLVAVAIFGGPPSASASTRRPATIGRSLCPRRRPAWRFRGTGSGS